MARVPYLNAEDLAEESRQLLARPGNLFRALAHSPEALRNFLRLGGYIRTGSTLDGRLRELAILQVGYLTRSEYEYAHHIEIGRTFGVTDDDLRALALETAGQRSTLGELERAVLRAAREMTQQLAASDETFAALEKHLSREHLIDLVLSIAYYNLVIRVLATLQIDLEPPYRPLLQEFPLP